MQSQSADPLAARSAETPAETQLDAILRVCASLTAPKPLEALLDNLLTEARTILPSDAAALYLADDAGLHLVCSQNDSARHDIRAALLNRDVLGRPGGQNADPADPVASHVAQTGQPLNIVDVHALPDDLPYRPLPDHPLLGTHRLVSILAAPMIDRNGKTTGVLELINRRDATNEVIPFSSRDEQTLASLCAVAAVSVRNARLRDLLSHSHLDTILRLASAAEFRDGDTGEHIRRMSCYCEAVARAMGRTPEWCRTLLFASPMHDVGKLAIPDAVLKKPGPLTPDERTTMQQHTVLGAKLLAGSNNEILAMAERIALGHHERWDGRGYPHGLAGPEINEEARIAAIADVFDALTNERIYKPAFGFEEAFKLIAAESGRHFDPVVLDAFMSAREEIESIYEAYRPS